ncbi:hypothetical protein RDI58_009915 [Solanum bulbocastanum]
MGLRK